MTALILFTRELAKELRVRATELNTAVDVGRTKHDLLCDIASCIESAAKRAFHL